MPDQRCTTSGSVWQQVYIWHSVHVLGSSAHGSVLRHAMLLASDNYCATAVHPTQFVNKACHCRPLCAEQTILSNQHAIVKLTAQPVGGATLSESVFTPATRQPRRLVSHSFLMHSPMVVLFDMRCGQQNALTIGCMPCRAPYLVCHPRL